MQHAELVSGQLFAQVFLDYFQAHSGAMEDGMRQEGFVVEELKMAKMYLRRRSGVVKASSRREGM